MQTNVETHLVVGGAGDLGHRIVAALLSSPRPRQVRVGLRGGLTGKHAMRAQAWVAAGAEVVDADLQDRDSLLRACDGVTAVISAVQGGPETIIDGQMNLLDACRQSGVARLVPSDFAEDLFSVPEGINPYLDLRRQFAKHLQSSGVGYTHVLNGGFMDVIFASPGMIQADAGTISFWGDGHMPLDFTTLDDVAAYVVAAVDNPATLNSVVEVAGDRRTVHQIADDYEAATGRSLTRICRGSIEEGYATLHRMVAAGAHPMALLPLQYLLPMMSGEGRLRHVANADYPAIRPTTLRSFLTNGLAPATDREAV
jgi:uncharacterized protein YbjT (DUF2867 family)